MSDAISVLIADDDEANRINLSAIVETLGYGVEAVATGLAALERLREGPTPEVVLLDVRMPELDGMEALRRYRASGGTAPVVMVSAFDEARTAVQALRLGATDYVTKPFTGEVLRAVLERIIAEHPPHRHLGTSTRTSPVSLGVSAAMRWISELCDRVADADVPVLLTGESGVGKDVVARQIHAKSARASRVFVKINCAALPGELLESELFGHERGSFTGAARTKPGQFELADGGTLFLDEIGEMPVSLQAKLLQALQDGEFYRIGGQRKMKVDARIIVATNRDLQRAMEQGSFREDLYYRLNVVHLKIPPLRERREDIPLFCDHFVEKYSQRYHRSAPLPPMLIERFLTYDWPGNIRELENLVRRFMVLGEPRYVLAELEEQAPKRVSTAIEAADNTVPLTVVESLPDLRIDLKEVGRQAAQVAERKAILTMLAYTDGNKREAAARLGISYKAILYKIREFGITRLRSTRTVLVADVAPPPALPAVG